MTNATHAAKPRQLSSLYRRYIIAESMCQRTFRDRKEWNIESNTTSSLTNPKNLALCSCWKLEDWAWGGGLHTWT